MPLTTCCQRKIGALGDITFDQAKKLAKRLRSEVVLGGDPAAQKAEKKAIPTYDALADQHYDYIKTYQKNPGNTEAIMRVHLRPKWGKKRLDEIKSQEIAKWLAELRQAGKAPATIEKIRIVFNDKNSGHGRCFIRGKMSHAADAGQTT